MYRPGGPIGPAASRLDASGGGAELDANKLTLKTQEALQDAQTKALRYGHVEAEPEHLLLALLDQRDALLPHLFARLDVDVQALRDELDQHLSGRPRVSGPGAAPGQVYVSQALARVLDAAEQEADRLTDEYVSVEHVAFAMIASNTQAGHLLTARGITRERFLEVLTQVRGSQRVTSATPEGSYEALEKYGRDLVEAARAGKMDPVVGRDAEIRRVIQILSRKTKNNPVLVGDPGVGKTAIVEGSRSGSCAAMSPRGSAAARSSPSTSARWSPVRNSEASSRSGSRRCLPRSRR